MAFARALFVQETGPATTPGLTKETWKVLYTGADVPGGQDVDFVEVDNVDYSVTAAQYATFVGAAIRARATMFGRTIVSNGVIMAAVTRV